MLLDSFRKTEERGALAVKESRLKKGEKRKNARKKKRKTTLLATSREKGRREKDDNVSFCRYSSSGGGKEHQKDHPQFPSAVRRGKRRRHSASVGGGVRGGPGKRPGKCILMRPSREGNRKGEGKKSKCVYFFISGKWAGRKEKESLYIFD